MVHKKTLELYNKAGFEYVQTTQDAVHARFEEETKGQPKRFSVDQIYRVRESGAEAGEEYLMYFLTTISTDINGNQKSKSELVGTHEEPVFNRTYNEDEHKTIVTGITGKNVVYDIPATRENLDKILSLHSRDIPSRTRFAIKDGDQSYGGFTRDEFLNRHFDDLLFKNIEGRYPRELKQPAFPPPQKTPTATTTTTAAPINKEEQPQPQQKRATAVKEIKKGLIIETQQQKKEEEAKEED